MTHAYLPTSLRRSLEKAIREARIVAEAGTAAAIRRLGVEESKAPAHLGDATKALRRRLRAHARALGDEFDRSTERQEVRHLIEAAAYAHWHRMLFARFLAERDLLRHPGHDVPVSLADCEELAAEEGLPDGWAVAERYAAAMLPAVFQPEDPVLTLELAPEHEQALQGLVRGLDATVFQASDSLGWTYQFWRAAEKDAVNKSGRKIGADELPAVTQLFTEPYMVRFLLHNTLGAWWAGKLLAARPELARSAADEDALRAACALPGVSWNMLRFVKEDEAWRPAAGTFPGWPTEARAITVLDPCCGSGHFLTEALPILSALRQAEEGLSAREAVAAVLRDNLFGLEIDERCVQIAAFAVALSAWAIGGWQALPLPHVAWVGAPPPLPKREFVALAEGNAELEHALAALHDLFAQAPLLGSLLELSGGDLFEAAKMREIERLLQQLLDKARLVEPERAEGVIAARGMTDAAALLHRHYTLQATNVPFLGKSKQVEPLSSYISHRFNASKANLATTMIDRMCLLSDTGGTIAFVSPQEWFFLGVFKTFRQRMLTRSSIHVVSDLGPAAFRDMNWWAARTALGIFSPGAPTTHSAYKAVDGDTGRDLERKYRALVTRSFSAVLQAEQVKDPDAGLSMQPFKSGPKLRDYADIRQGIGTADMERFIAYFWEINYDGRIWVRYQTAPENGKEWSGRNRMLKWENGSGVLANSPQARVCGHPAWDRKGLAVAVNRDLPRTYYTGEKFDCTVAIIVPSSDEDHEAVAACVLADDFGDRVRGHDQALSVTESAFGKIDFDRSFWQHKAQERFGGQLPEPYSNDPAQWLFHGHPATSDTGTALHVALARLCGYRWPAESDDEMRLSDDARTWIARAAELPAGDDDGILCLPAVAGERSLADRLRMYLAAAFGAEWSDATERRLIAEADERFEKRNVKDASLEGWLRERAFQQHCILFQQRPFLWHVWDGTKDGFAAFLHYHRLGQATLEKLTYTTLGDWIARAKAEGNTRRQEKGRELQQALERILEGEKPFDIFVRWKGLERLPIGWDPDLDDGVRMNIRPFVEAGVLRDTPNVKWTKDRGKDVESAPWYPVFKGERINDYHTTRAEKHTAREAAAARMKGAA